MRTANGQYCIVYNGEIYNHVSLRKQLENKGYVFRSTHSDTEVLLHGYAEWGPELSNKLNGMWAFAIYDKANRILFLSRDRFGQKPLFYTVQKGLFAFASELASLLAHPSIIQKVSTRSVQKYFAYGYIPAPHSMYEGIYKLPGGCNAIVQCSTCTLKLQRYWKFVLEPFEILPKQPVKTWGEQLRALLEQAVARRMIADVPLGVFLSGGIDSTSVAYFAQKNEDVQGVKTYSIGFKERSFDESGYAKMASAYLGTDHHQMIMPLEKVRQLFIDVYSRLDEPMGDSSLLAAYLLCRETRKHVTVALGGDGADELFAGYDPFRALCLAEWYRRVVPKPVHMAIRLLAAKIPATSANMSWGFRLNRTLRGLSYPPKMWNPAWIGPLDYRDIVELFNEPIPMDELYEEALMVWEGCEQKNIIDKTLQFYTNMYLQDDILVKIDRASMMNSLEVRSPFLDYDVVELVRKIPAHYKYRNGQTKYLLKKTMEPCLPKDIVKRPKKGFGIPVAQWFHERVFDICTEAVPLCMNSSFVERKIKNHYKKREDNRAFLWNTLVLNRYIMNNENTHNY